MTDELVNTEAKPEVQVLGVTSTDAPPTSATNVADKTIDPGYVKLIKRCQKAEIRLSKRQTKNPKRLDNLLVRVNSLRTRLGLSSAELKNRHELGNVK